MRKIDLLKAMQVFCMVVEKQSFSAASVALNLVTSAVSKQVSDLEKHFSTKLLQRTTRVMRLTPEGEYYLTQFKDILSRVEALEDVSDQRQQRLSGQLCISAPSDSSSLGFLQSASDFTLQHPDVHISWLFVNRFVNMVEEGVDLSIRVGNLSDSSFIARHYADTQVHFVASPDYLKKSGTLQHPDDLAAHACIVDSSNHQPRRWRYLETKKQHNSGNKSQQRSIKQVTVQGVTQVNDGAVAAKLAVQGLGIAYLPAFLMQSFLDDGRLVAVLRSYELDPVPISLLFPSNRLQNPALNALIDYLLQQR